VIRVLLNVSSPALRAGLRALLSSDKTISVINDSLDEDDLRSEADVMITSASSRFSARIETDSASSAATLLLSDDQLNVREMRRLFKVWGVLPSDASAEELTAAVHALSQGLIVGTSTLLFESESEPSSHGPLSDRESEVLGLLAKGLANKQIALALGISEHTVKFHVSSIYTKLNVTNRTEALRAGLRGGWIAL
jgi:NarL family two-component system response regulator YdfI